MTQNIEIDFKKVLNNKSIIITVVLLILFVLAIFYLLIVGNEYFVPEADKTKNNHKEWKENIPESETGLLEATTTSPIKIEESVVKLVEPQIKPEEPQQVKPTESPNIPEKPILIRKAIEGLSDYRGYLYYVNDLIVKFLEDKDYQAQINQVQAIDLPPEIAKILSSMEYYREHYLIDSVDTVRVFPMTGSWVENFIKIEKKSDITIQKEKLRAEIITNLKLFTEYFYSEKLQQKFVE